ncbi:MAG TPA: glycosyltransferase family 39 protein, partial [Dehalococcoidia bacterium]|nr:glycosyltransferase family 39 protein [Dehalococcoidia bacterium]
MALAALLRFAIVSMGGGFPLNDGGMFYVMVEDLKANAYRLPEYTSYNGGSIPFAYPPAAFYMTAAISDVAGISTLDLLLFLPAVFSVFTVVAVYLLAKAMLPTERMAVAATLVFAFVPRAFNWEIVGGGLTRSPGFFFAVLAVWQGYLLYSRGEKRHLIATAVLAAATVLFHPEMGWFVAASLGVFFSIMGRNRPAVLRSAALAAAVCVLTAPWWLEVLLRLGPDPLLAASQTGGHSPFQVLRPFLFEWTEEPLFPLAAALGLLGVLACLRDRRFLLPAWLLAFFILDPRKAATTAEVPLAMLAAIGLFDVVLPLLRRPAPGGVGEVTPRWAYAAVGLALFVYAPLSALYSTTDERSPLVMLPEADREAMAWVKANTPPDAVFLVMPATGIARVDPALEWFPALAQRRSVLTVQGTEWISGQFDTTKDAYEDLVDCLRSAADCLQTSVAKGDFDHDF